MHIKIEKDAALANAITHSGVFHADEVMATVILGKIQGELSVLRTNAVPEPHNPDAVIYDIGGGELDHHQASGNGERQNGVPYAAAGLVWRKYGMKAVEGADDPEYVWRKIDRELMQGIDALDNGAMPPADYPAQALSFTKMVHLFNKNWDEDGNMDDCFLKAVGFAETVFDLVYKNAASGSKAGKLVREAIEASKDHIMVLERFAPWQEHLFMNHSEKAEGIHFVVYPSVRGGYNWQCVPDKPGSFGQRKPVPVGWRGLSAKELREATGVATAVFCHKEGFMGSAETFEDAYKMAWLAEKAE